MSRLRALLLIVVAGLGGPALGQGVTLPEYHLVELDNGAVFILSEKHDVPLIGVTALIRGGSVTDPEGKSGLSALFAEMLQKGAGARDAEAFASAVDSSGATLTATADLETISISGEFLARDAGLLVELLSDMLLAPSLDGEEFAKLRDRSVDLLRAARDGSPQSLSSVYGNAWLFGDHPYGNPVSGDETSLGGLRHRDLLDYYEGYVGADRLIVALVGDFDAEAMSQQLTDAFSGWRGAVEPLPAIEPPALSAGGRVLLVDKPGATQSYFWIGGIGVSRNFEQRAELNIANSLFGGRFTSLLMDEMRTKAGLTYNVRSVLLRPSQPGSVAIVSFTKTDSTIVAIDMALELLAQLRTKGFDETLIASGKNYILGQFPPQLETSAQLADQFAALHAAGLDESYVNNYGEAITAASSEDIQAVIEGVYPAADELVLVVIGDAESIRDVVTKYGEVTEISLAEPRFRPQP